jgi:predicted  nucleic acid-binding Zn-ribbon protein
MSCRLAKLWPSRGNSAGLPTEENKKRWVREKMSDLQTFVKNLQFKKAVFGGFETEAVYAAMRELTAMYLEEIAQLRKEKAQLKTDYDAATSQLSKVNSEIQRLQYQLEEAQKSQYQSAKKFKAFSLAIDALNADKEEILNKAKKEADGIIAKATEKCKLANEEYLAQKHQMEQISANISDIKQRFGMTLDNAHSLLANLLSVIEEVQNSGIERQCDGANELIKKAAGSVKQNECRE